MSHTLSVTHAETFGGTSPAPLESRGGPSAPPLWIALALPSLLLALLLFAGAYAIQRLRGPFGRALSSTHWPASPQPASTPSALRPRQAGGLPAAFAPSVLAWEGQILAWSKAHDLPAELVAIVMQIESCGDPTAQSSAGAQGLFQVMPFHFGYGEDPLDPNVNAQRGLDYLAKAWDLSEGDVARTLAAYNGGLGLLHEPPSSWPAETQRYVAWGTGLWQEILSGRVPSPTLDRWLAAGGVHLCQQARSRLAQQ